MTFAAIWALLLPILMSSLKEFLPRIIGKVLTNWLNPPTMIESAKIKIDDALVTGDLRKLGEINSTVIHANQLDLLTKGELTSMLSLVP